MCAQCRVLNMNSQLVFCLCPRWPPLPRFASHLKCKIKKNQKLFSGLWNDCYLQMYKTENMSLQRKTRKGAVLKTLQIKCWVRAFIRWKLTSSTLWFPPLVFFFFLNCLYSFLPTQKLESLSASLTTSCCIKPHKTPDLLSSTEAVPLSHLSSSNFFCVWVEGAAMKCEFSGEINKSSRNQYGSKCLMSPSLWVERGGRWNMNVTESRHSMQKRNKHPKKMHTIWVGRCTCGADGFEKSSFLQILNDKNIDKVRMIVVKC